jgi:abortive infection alpha-like protein
VPLLEYASLEDEADEEMADRWAALLANAAAGNQFGAEVIPSFPAILAQLSAQEVRILAYLYDRQFRWQTARDLGLRSSSEDIDSSRWVGADQERVRELLGETSRKIHLGNLQRLGLVRIKDRREDHTVATLVNRTRLGEAFVAACSPPTGAQARAQSE